MVLVLVNNSNNPYPQKHIEGDTWRKEESLGSWQCKRVIHDPNIETATVSTWDSDIKWLIC